jgi:hypothetical protein
MLTLKDRKDAVKAEIPKELYMAIVKLQAAEELDWEGACMRGAKLIDANSAEFKRMIELEAQRLYKQRFMKELNKARETITNNAWKSGAQWVRRHQDNFRVPCSICREPLYFSSSDSNWESEIKPTLYDAFKNWYHVRCKSS